jgi:thiol-disulfide isomerase/thioredoxin
MPTISFTNWRVIASLALVATIVGVGTFLIVQQKETKISESTQKIFTGVGEGITYTDLEGREVALEEYLGRVLVVTTWASWSPFSEADLIALNELSKSYSTEAVIFLAINRKETKEQAQRFALSLPELTSVRLVLDPEDFFYQSVAGYTMPETVIFDQQGEITEHIRGVFDTALVKSKIDPLVTAE